MKRVFVIVLAVLMLGLSVPKQSEANGAWLPAVIIGGFFLSAVHAAAHTFPVYPYYAPGQAYVNPPPVNQDYYRYGPGQADAYGPPAQAYVNPPPQNGWGQNGWGRPPVPSQNGWGLSQR